MHRTVSMLASIRKTSYTWRTTRTFQTKTDSRNVLNIQTEKHDVNKKPLYVHNFVKGGCYAKRSISLTINLILLFSKKLVSIIVH